MKVSFQAKLQFLLIVVLTVLPVIAINYGWSFIQSRSTERAKNHQRDLARQLLEPLTLKWQFKQQMERIASRFLREFEKILPKKNQGDPPLEELKNLVSSIFKPPFPPSDLWVFHYPSWTSSKPPRTVYSPTQNPFGKHSLALAFHFLISKKMNIPMSGSEELRGKKLLCQLFGQDIPYNILAGSLVGVPTKTLHRNKLYWLVWDVIREGDIPVGGFILLVPQGNLANRAAMEMAIQSASDAKNGVFHGFVRVHESPIEDVLPKPMKKSALFRNWWQNWRNNNDFKKIEIASSPTSSPWEVELGNRTMFSQIIPNSSHLALVILPRIFPKTTPFWLFCFKIFSFSIWALVIIRGKLCHRWPRIAIKWRFAGLYFLASALPLCLVTIAAISYLQEREESLLRESKQKLLSDLKRIDQSKDQMQSQYLSAFNSLLHDQKFGKILRVEGFSHPNFLDKALVHFSHASPSLKLATLAFFDLNGKVASWVAPNIDSRSLNGLTRFYRAILLNCMYSRLKEIDDPTLPKKIPWDEKDEILIQGYEKATDVKTTAIGEERCSVPEIIEVGGAKTTKIHDFITFKGVPRFAVMVAWRANDLDNETITHASKDFQRDRPGVGCLVYQFSDDFLEEKIHLPPSYSIEKDYSEGALLTAKAASKGLGSVFRVFQEKGILIVAVQSQSFPGKIVVGVENIAHIFEEIQTKFWLLVGLLILSVISIFFLGLVTSSRIVTPITHVKRGLDAVAIGNFDVRVGIPRSDELGQLTQAFDQMIKELDRRKRLTTIVSETTLDAMAKHGDSDLQGGSLADRLTQGSRVSVIFLVSDIRNFTTLCESQPVKVITSLLNNHFDRMSEIIGAHGGRINKFIGDAINALFYLNENDRQETAKRAIETGLEMLNSLRKINLSRAQSGLFPYSIGVGLAMGEVIMGGLGDPRSPYFDHAVMGSPVKDASWLESLSKLVPHCPLVMCPKIARLAPWLGDKLVPLRDYDEKAVVFRHS